MLIQELQFCFEESIDYHVVLQLNNFILYNL